MITQKISIRKIAFAFLLACTALVPSLQAGTFEDNSDKWHVLGKEHADDSFTETAIPYADSNGKLIEDPTNLFYDAFGYLHTPSLIVSGEGSINTLANGVAV